jgi:hypothetical protein
LFLHRSRFQAINFATQPSAIGTAEFSSAHKRGEPRLDYESSEVRVFYQDLPGPVRVG